MPRKNILDKERIKAKLLSRRRVTEKGCWEYTGVCDPYGRLDVHYRRYGVHRLAAWIWKGFDLNSSLMQRHRCDNPPCFNPEHLVEGTNQQNQFDRRMFTPSRVGGI